MKENLINALMCAIAVLDGTGGGYSQQNKYEAKLELMGLLLEEKNKIETAQANKQDKQKET